ncbi:MAG: acyl-phosphate glycerol 3-phosphate acyltransferase [Chromatiales bacterium 21-64-14]|nr:MAG: acyl-phosphate glycerol 3-phosphate acyltransferase [Chromatiales bacterium 21-64-14]HQU17195.1 glycerol-3-phosphate 1-O-acyltransferase PlsY [Gammaproteobacteria bacterium]
MLLDVIMGIVGYLSGSVSSAVMVCRVLRLPDPRDLGSRNPGATNVLRFGGKGAAAATLVGDVAKGLIPVALAKHLGVGPGALGVVGLAAFLGHLYPVFFGFKGGKGVATALGVLLGLDWRVGVAAVAIWLLVVAAVRISSAGALIAALAAPLLVAWWLHASALVVATALMSLLLVWRHRSNIRGLLAGTEPRIGRS